MFYEPNNLPSSQVEALLGKYGIVSERSSAIEPGWIAMMEALIEKLIEHGWNRQLFQVKEKAGGLRFSPASDDEHLSKICKEYNLLSNKICEFCGDPGRLSQDSHSHWFKTLCSRCADKYEFSPASKGDRIWAMVPLEIQLQEGQS